MYSPTTKAHYSQYCIHQFYAHFTCVGIYSKNAMSDEPLRLPIVRGSCAVNLSQLAYILISLRSHSLRWRINALLPLGLYFALPVVDSRP